MDEEQNQQGASGPPSGLHYNDDLHEPLNAESEQAGPVEPAPTEQHPVLQSLWENIKAGLTDPNGAREMGRSVLRGGADMVKEAARTTGELTSWADSKLPETEQKTDVGFVLHGVSKAASGLAQAIDANEDDVFGKHSKNAVASFTEDATQFGAGMAIMPEAEIPEAAEGAGMAAKVGLKALGVGQAAARGAVVQGAMFDPKSGDYARLLAKMPTNFMGVRTAAQALSINGDDSILEQRLKAAAQGAIPGIAIDALAAGAKLTWAGALKAAGKETPLSQKIGAEAAKVMADIQSGKYTPPDAHLALRPTEGGQWQVRVVNPDLFNGVMPEGTDLAHGAPTAAVFNSRGEGEAYVSSANTMINEHLSAAQQAGGLPEGDVEKFRSTLRRFLNEPTPADLQSLSEGTHLNLSGFLTPSETAPILEAMSQTMREEIDRSRALGQKDEDLFNATKQIMGAYGPDQTPGLTAAAMRHGAPLDQMELLQLSASQQMRGLATKIMNTHSALELRPHDAIQQELLRGYLGNLFDLQEAYAGTQGGAGRLLRSFSLREKFNAFMQGKTPDLAPNTGETFRARVQQHEAQMDMAEAANKETAAAAQGESAEGNGKPRRGKKPNDGVKEIHPLREPKQDMGVPEGTERELNDPSQRQANIDKLGLSDQEEHIWNDPAEQAQIEHSPEGENLTADGEVNADNTLASQRAKGQYKTALEDRPGLRKVAGMDQRIIMGYGKMVKLAGGQPYNIPEVLRAANTVYNGWGKNPSKAGAVMSHATELLMNWLISGPKTVATVATSNVLNTAHEVLTRMAAGALTGNGETFHEGVDRLAGLMLYTRDNIRGAYNVLRSDNAQSILDPRETHIATEGTVGNAIRLPSRIHSGLNELFEGANYRSYVYAQSLKVGRQLGLEGDALAGYMEDAMHNAFSPEGHATLPNGLEYAHKLAFRSDLGNDTFAGKVTQFLNNTPQAKIINPFAKMGFNLWRQWIDNTPILNMAFARNRAIMAAGGPDAAQLMTKTTLAGSMYLYAVHKAMAGELTGRGPANPSQRAMLQQNGWKPNTLKIGNESIDLTRGAPFTTPLMLVGDIPDMLKGIGEMHHGHAKFSDLGVAITGAMAAAFEDRSLMDGTTQFFDAWGKNDASAMKKWMEGMYTGFMVPQAVSQMNADKYYREVDGFKSALMSKIPGLSEHLPAVYGLDGKPETRDWSVRPFANRGPWPNDNAWPQVLREHNISISKLPKTSNNANVDWTDHKSFDNGSGKSPYERWNDLIAQQNLGDKLQTLVGSDQFKNALDGTMENPGGLKGKLVKNLVTEIRQQTKQQVLREFPKLAERVRQESMAKGETMKYGSSPNNTDDATSILSKYQ